ncbi:MAG: asparaginase [Clostridia bacterium]|nr:asparaginase [Clostridia bacterium]
MVRRAAHSKKKVIVIATGGTIAGVGDPGKTAGYKPGTLTAEELIGENPLLEEVAAIDTDQICNVNSDDISTKDWLEIARTINQRAKDPEVAGFVITHGTDTLEETAYFLNLTVKTDKPVVLTGSMRPSSSVSADGPMNLYEAVCVAASKKTRGLGVLVVFSDRIFTARMVMKTSTYHVTAISAGELGAIGMVRDGQVFIYENPTKRHTKDAPFDVSVLNDLPKVAIIYFSVDADPDLLVYAAKHSDGLVIAGAGAGEFSVAFKKVIEKLKLPVVISSRIDDGIIIKENLLCKNTVASDNLSPQKAAILLRLALTVTQNKREIQRLFDTF